MLEKLPLQIKLDVSMLKYILDGGGDFPHMEEREEQINMLKESISDIVISILMREV